MDSYLHSKSIALVGVSLLFYVGFVFHKKQSVNELAKSEIRRYITWTTERSDPFNSTLMNAFTSLEEKASSIQILDLSGWTILRDRYDERQWMLRVDYVDPISQKKARKYLWATEHLERSSVSFEKTSSFRIHGKEANAIRFWLAVCFSVFDYSFI